eukprot:g9421.t1
MGETNDAQVIVNKSQHNYSIRTDSFFLKQWMIVAIVIVGCLFVFANVCILACRECALDQNIKRMLGQDAWSKYEKNIAKDKLKEKSDFEKEKVQELSKISVRPDSLNRHINYYVRHPNETLDDPNAGRRGGESKAELQNASDMPRKDSVSTIEEITKITPQNLAAVDHATYKQPKRESVETMHKISVSDADFKLQIIDSGISLQKDNINKSGTSTQSVTEMQLSQEEFTDFSFPSKSRRRRFTTFGNRKLGSGNRRGSVEK